MKTFIQITLFILCSQWAFPQTDWAQKLRNNTFCNPVKIPMLLAGNFCELRSNHFHGGLDIKTKGVEGYNLHSIEDGYISRIKISAYGYGKALYIHHPKSGVTSVYAHMKSFSPKIKEYIQNIQKQKQKNSIDHSLKDNELPVKRDDIIGLSGNTGGSVAPHLHFELRDSKNQHPINPMYAFDFNDSIKPVIQELMVYDLSTSRQADILKRKKLKPLKLTTGKYTFKDTILTSPHIGFGIKMYDQATGANNKNGVYSTEFYIDNELVWSIEMDEYSYAETRYLNSLIDYPYYKEFKQRFVKLFKDPNNKLNLYTTLKNNGHYTYDPHKVYYAKVICKDLKGNISLLDWHFKTSEPFLESIPKGNYTINHNEDISLNHDELEISFSAKSLYTSLDLNIDYKKDDSIPSFKLEPEFTPIHQKVNVKIECPDVYKARIDKVCVIHKIGKYKSWVKPKINRLNLDFRIRNFGSFTFDIDTDDPYATFPHLKENQNASKHKRISIKAYDLHSGVKSYSGKLDGKWVILEYDPKRNSFYYYFEEKPDGQKHTFEFEIIDICSNKNIIKRNFVR